MIAEDLVGRLRKNKKDGRIEKWKDGKIMADDYFGRLLKIKVRAIVGVVSVWKNKLMLNY